MLSTLLISFFAGALLFAVACSVFSKNNVHAVLWLVCAFFCTSWLYIVFSAHFIAMLLIIVYVGAIATLFLFIVMMLDATPKQSIKIQTMALSGVVFVIFVALFAKANLTLAFTSPFKMPNNFIVKISDSATIGLTLYTKYGLLFQICGLILLAAMVGSIYIVKSSGLLNKNIEGVKTQNISSQVLRKATDCFEIVKNVKVGHGMDI